VNCLSEGVDNREYDGGVGRPFREGGGDIVDNDCDCWLGEGANPRTWLDINSDSVSSGESDLTCSQNRRARARRTSLGCDGEEWEGEMIGVNGGVVSPCCDTACCAVT